MDFFGVALRRNPDLITLAAELHASGAIPAETYVIDADAVSRNARLLAAESRRWGLQNYFEAKQFGRIPLLCQRLIESGFPQAIAIDVEEAKVLHAHGVPVAHVGHLGQIPTREIRFVLERIGPEVVTVYSVEKAGQIAAVARELGMAQPLLLRVNGPEDIMLATAAGGFREDDIVDAASRIHAMDAVSVEGVTTYPVLRYDLLTRDWVFTPNFETLLRARTSLEQAGFEVHQVNAAGNTCTSTVRMLVEGGATHGEPGHAFMGSNPGHAFQDLEEIPAQVYVTEVSHFWGGSAYAYATGLIGNPTIGIWNSPMYESLRGAVGAAGNVMQNQVLVDPPHYVNSDPANYMYCRIKPSRSAQIRVGDTLVLGMRTQIYKTTSARAAVVEGISSGHPRVLGLFDRTGNQLDPETWLPLGSQTSDRPIWTAPAGAQQG